MCLLGAACFQGLSLSLGTLLLFFGPSFGLWWDPHRLCVNWLRLPLRCWV